MGPAQFGQHPEAIQVGHVDVEQHQVDAAGRDRGERGLAVGDAGDAIAEIGQAAGQQRADLARVVDQQDVAPRAAVGGALGRVLDRRAHGAPRLLMPLGPF